MSQVPRCGLNLGVSEGMETLQAVRGWQCSLRLHGGPWWCGEDGEGAV